MANDPRISELRDLESGEGCVEEGQSLQGKDCGPAQRWMARTEDRFKDHGAGLAEILIWILAVWKIVDIFILVTR